MIQLRDFFILLVLVSSLSAEMRSDLGEWRHTRNYLTFGHQGGHPMRPMPGEKILTFNPCFLFFNRKPEKSQNLSRADYS